MTADEIKSKLASVEEALNNIDANHNGMIDPDEAASDRGSNYLFRIFRDTPAPHYPMSIKDILALKETSYKSRGSGAPPNGPTSGPSSSAPGGPTAGTMGFGIPTSTSAGLSSPASGDFISPPGMGFGTPSLSSTTSGAASSGLSTSGTSSTNRWGGGWGGGSRGFGMSSSPGTASSSGTSVTVPSSTSSSSEIKSPLRKSGRFLSARERLPKGLPSWFIEKDTNGDGQITMDEYTPVWTPDKAAEFDRYDLNHDGIITAEEVLKVEKKSTVTASSH
jgi:hypothetical protein